MHTFSRLTVFLLALALPAAAQSTLPEGKGKDVVNRMCGTQCHGIDKFISERLSKQGWSNVVDTMLSRGATGTDEEIDLVIDYLAAHFGRDSAPAKVNVNSADAKELQSALELSSEEAGEIVEYRGKQGKFKDWEDLLKVPNVDAKKLENKKNQIVF